LVLRGTTRPVDFAIQSSIIIEPGQSDEYRAFVYLLSSQCQEVAFQQHVFGAGASRKTLDRYQSYGSGTSENIGDDGFMDANDMGYCKYALVHAPSNASPSARGAVLLGRSPSTPHAMKRRINLPSGV
jgi:hypothetical protein